MKINTIENKVIQMYVRLNLWVQQKKDRVANYIKMKHHYFLIIEADIYKKAVIMFGCFILGIYLM